MATALTALLSTIKLNAKAVSGLTPSGSLSNPGATTSENFNIQLTFGTGVNKNDLLFQTKELNKAASGFEDYDLAGGVEDEYGNVITFAKVKALIVANISDTEDVTASVIKIGVAAAAPWKGFFNDVTDAILLPAGGVHAIFCHDADGVPVTATTDDILRITNTDGSDAASWKLIIIGESA